MKKISKIQINPERMMKNEELMILRGGYRTFFCQVFCEGDPAGSFPVNADSQQVAQDTCCSLFPSYECVCG